LILLRTLLIVGVILAIAAVIGLIHSALAAVVVLATGLLGIVAYHAGYLARLHHWAALPRQRELPIGMGSWGHALDRLNRFMRQEAGERAETASELERVHAAVDLLPDGLIVLDQYNLVQWSNRAARELHGIFGTRRPVDHFIRQPEFLRFLERQDFSEPIVLELPARPGRVFALKIVPTIEAYRLLVTRDVTEATRLEQMRRDFVANVSHEIRTPLTVIAGFVETLLDIDMPADERRRCLEMVRKQAATMQRLVDDLLTLASLDSATQPAARDPVDVPAMLQGLAAEARALSAGRHTVSVQIDTPVDRVLATPAELESAVRNLVSNAVRYTPDGGQITLGWRIDNGEGRISVRDTGIGIAAEHIPRLTERFYRVDRGRSRETGGTGLGLAIVKHVAHLHQASLEIRSSPGEGSTFGLRLPSSRIVWPANASSDPSLRSSSRSSLQAP